MQQIHSPEILLEYTCLIAQLYGSNPAHLGWRHGQGELKDGEDTWLKWLPAWSENICERQE